ncbi:MAG TPA: substrate-binding domain-containing protein [Burkholderiaceae bacterium]|nr:substrate-binding domain-containing protein [Burkholderiaceae bacterium]
MKPRRPTIRDVAKAAGVSVGTASRALNRSGLVSEAAITKVTAAAARLGFEPDAIAQSMRRRATGVIGVMVSDFSNPLYASTITATEARLQRAGYALLLANTHNDKRREKQLLDLFRRRRIDGLVLGPCESEDPDLVERVRGDYFPVAAMDRDFGARDSGLHVDHFNGAVQATRYLLNLGHTRIALLTSTPALRPGRERIEGFKSAHAERGLKPDPALIRAERSSMEFAFSEALALLSLAEPPTAFICLGTRILAGVLQGLRHSGRSVPEDASVISVGDTDLSRLFSPSITALTWDFQAVGEAIAELILKRIAPAEAPEPERIVVTTQLILRESCAPVRRGVANGQVQPGSRATS